MKKEDITFIFTGHNIKWFMVIAAESLVYNSQIDRSQILIFDDESTDGTREEFERRGMKVITWDDKTKEKYLACEQKEDPCVRVGQILTSAWKQAEGRYLCFLDGDTAYYDDFVGRLLEIIRSYNAEEDAFFGIKREHDVPLPPFMQMIPYFKYNIYQRIMFLDKEKMAEYGICGENIDTTNMLYEEYENDFINQYETGTILYNEILEKNVPHTFITYLTEDYMELVQNTEHLHWASSSTRYSPYNTCTGYVDEVLSHFDRERLQDLCRKLNIDIKVAIESYLSNVQKSAPY